MKSQITTEIVEIKYTINNVNATDIIVKLKKIINSLFINVTFL